MNARPIATVSSSPDDVEAHSPHHCLLGRVHALNPTALNTQSATEICPTTRNPFLETPDQGVYPNTTDILTMDKEDAANQKGKKLDYSGYDATKTPAKWTDHRKQINRS